MRRFDWQVPDYPFPFELSPGAVRRTAPPRRRKRAPKGAAPLAGRLPDRPKKNPLLGWEAAWIDLGGEG
jgi:hypothetical protein